MTGRAYGSLPRMGGALIPVVVPGREAGNHPLVEAGGQYIHGFRRGLDYAFIRSVTRADAERIIQSIESSGS